MVKASGHRFVSVLVALQMCAACASGPPPALPAPAPAPQPATPPTPSPIPPPMTPKEPVREMPVVRPPARDSTPPKGVRRILRRVATSPRGRLPRARTDTLAPRALADSLRVCAGGDVTLGTNLDAGWARMAAKRIRDEFATSDHPDSLLIPLRPLVSNADVVLVNVESAIGEGRAPSKCGPRSTNCFAFRAPTASGDALRRLTSTGSVVGNVANNHARDAGDEGRDSTIALLTRAGVHVTGADTIATPVVTPAGDTIGVLGFYTSSDSPDARDTAAVHRHVERASQQYPLVIVTMHLGAEGATAQRTRDATEVFLKRIDRGNPVAFADAAVRGGAALVIGHGPHVVRAIEWRDRGALVAYSLGNLLTYGPFGLKEPMNRGVVLCATIDTTGRVSSATLAPTVQLAPGVLQADSLARSATLVDSLGRLDFPRTAVRVGPGGALLPRTAVP